MKQPDELSPGSSRKTLLKRTARSGERSPALAKSTRRENRLHKPAEEDLIKIFGEK